MRRFTKIFCLQIALVFAVVFLLASFAQASGNHHSHHQIVSPFDKVSADKPLHCLLNAHLHQIKQDCPHQKNHSKSAEFRADCGSHPGASHQKGFSFGNDLSQLAQDEFIHHLALHSFYPLIDYKVRLFPLSIEHPPQLS
ncbi:MAG: hypothetical protein ACI8PD_000972 [Nitrospinales bacterium]|jgi:hypothetical protein